MKISNYVLGGIFALTSGFTGFAILDNSQRQEEESKMETTLRGYPISCETNAGQGYSGLIAVVKNEEGKYILCKGMQRMREDLPVLETAALIKSEMNDGDKETIEFRGIYRGDKFEIWSVSANGYTLGRK